MIPRHPVQSSVLKNVGYEPDTLIVELRDSSVYSYSGVKPEHYAAMMKSRSVGSYYRNQIVPNFKAVKIS